MKDYELANPWDHTTSASPGGFGDRIVTGKCGKCGGVVSTPRAYWGVGRVPETCESCGASVDVTDGLPVKEMR